MFSHFHRRANFMGTMAQVIMVPDRRVRPSPMNNSIAFRLS
jgi:hypothetical protein